MTHANFATWRARLRLTQAGAASALGMSPRQIWAYEHGTAEIPLYIELACAALALGLTSYPEE